MPESDIQQLWSDTLRAVQQEIGRPSFDAWLKNTRPVAVEGDTLIVAAPNPFVCEWLNGKLAHPLNAALRRCVQGDLKLRFVVAEPPTDETAATTDWATSEPPAATRPLTAGQPLNPKYTFDTFVIGSGNRLAHAAALAVAEAPARAYNPLFLYGGVGLGKTHLMQAIAHHVLHHNPAARVVYVTSETFTNEIINSIRDGRTVHFRNRYRNVDILLVDDIQFIAGKETTQEEFFHTFNSLHEANKQIVLSSDRPPKEIPTLEERLRSRFEWGLISDIQAPDLETRIAILRKKAQLEQLVVPDDVVYYIAERVTSNIRELEGALIRLIAHSSLTGQPITLETARASLRDLLPDPPRVNITIARIQEVVAEHFGLRVEDLKLRKRTRAVAFPRQIAMFLCRDLTDASLPRIGEEFGGRDHTTVLHACEKIARERDRDATLRQILHQLTQRLRQEQSRP